MDVLSEGLGTVFMNSEHAMAKIYGKESKVTIDEHVGAEKNVIW